MVSPGSFPGDTTLFSAVPRDSRGSQRKRPRWRPHQCKDIFDEKINGNNFKILNIYENIDQKHTESQDAMNKTAKDEMTRPTEDMAPDRVDQWKQI